MRRCLPSSRPAALRIDRKSAAIGVFAARSPETARDIVLRAPVFRRGEDHLGLTKLE